MNTLLDTQVLLWFLYSDERFIDELSEYVLNTDNEIYYSTVSIWEIAIKHKLHPDYFPFSAKEISDACLEVDFINLPLFDKHIFQLEKINGHPKHKDPFDHMLLAQVKRSKLKLLTVDKKFKYYDEDCLIVI